jgi:cell division control protein 45
MLRTNNVQYKVVPISGLGDLRRLNDEFIQDSDELRSVVMLNCGAIVNLPEILELPEDVRVIVLDSHRPVHLSNVYTVAEQIVVFNDGTLMEDEMPSDGSDLDLDPYSQSEEDSDISDFDSDEEAPSDPRADASGEGVPERGAAGGDENVAGNAERKRKKSGAADGPDRKKAKGSKPRRKRMKKQRRGALSGYYSGATTAQQGSPAAALAYEMAKELNKDDNDLLWLAIVGTTHQYLSANMSRNAYVELATDFRQEVNTKNAGSAQTVVAEDGTVVRAAERGRIVESPNECRFLLHRHWTLYEAMLHSDYVATRLGVWTHDGKARLDECLARAGVPLAACRQKFVFMSSQLKRRLEEQLSKIAPEYGLDHVFYGSFVRHSSHGYGAAVSAADAVACVTALLDASVARAFCATGAGAPPGARAAPNALARSAGTGEGPGTAAGRGAASSSFAEGRSEGTGARAAAAATASRRVESSVQAEAVANFNAAYDALGAGSSTLLEKGAALSMDLQQAVTALGTSIIEKKQLRTAGPFRYTLLAQLADSDAELFTRPGPLAKLARFISSAKRETDKRWRGRLARPYILCCNDERRGRFLIVGVVNAGSGWNQTGGGVSAVDAQQAVRLGRAFELAGKEVNAGLDSEDMQEVFGFDKAVATVKRADVQAFLSVLIEILTGVH